MQCARKLFLPSLVVVWAASCAVFPDEAVLPNGGGAAAAAGHDGEPQAGTGGAAPGAGAGAGGGVDEGGAPSLGGGGSSGGSEPLAGASPGSGGGGGGACTAPLQLIRETVADTWIELAKPTTGHGSDPALNVAGGSEERRALMQFSLPAAPPGATLVRGTVTLQLEFNADATLVERHLELRRLTQDVSEERATWRNWGNGSTARWLLPGGDYGPVLATATIPALTTTGPVTFDVTTALDAAWSTTVVPLPLILLEVGDAPTPPAELAFTSRQGDASGVPELLIEYCP